MRRLVTIPLAELVRDDRLRFRGILHEVGGVVEQYAEAMREAGGWGDFPPALAVELTEPHSYHAERVDGRGYGNYGTETYPAGTFVLVGGFTRCKAADAAAVADACAEVEPGTWADALKLAWSQNSRHGKPRSSEELAAVLASIHQDDALAEAGEREVAQLAGCSRASVNRFRRALDSRPGDPATPGSPTPAAKPLAPFSLNAKDRWGRPVPTHLRPHFECGPDLDKHAASMRTLASSIARLKHGHDGQAQPSPGLLLLDAKRMAVSLLALADGLESKCPWIVCPSCGGAGCAKCGDRGWLPREAMAELPAPLERKARSFAAGAAV